MVRSQLAWALLLFLLFCLIRRIALLTRREEAGSMMASVAGSREMRMIETGEIEMRRDVAIGTIGTVSLEERDGPT